MYFKRSNYASDVYITDSDGNRYRKDVTTKWHKLKERDGRIYRAECGYEYDFLLETPNTARNVFNLRVCSKCEPRDSEKELPLDAPF